MGLGSIIGKVASMGIGDLMKGAGELAKDLREAITGDISSDKKAELLDKVTSLCLILEQLQVKVQELQSKIIIAEAQGKSWLQRNWRPLLMAEFGIIIGNNYIISPWLKILFGWNVIMDIPPDMWGLLKIGVGGYIVGRTGEKITEMGGLKALLGKLTK
jgi:hypothetical protein